MFTPTPLHLPPYPFKLKNEGSHTLIFDEIRKKYLVLTPEEWVRQHFIKYLVLHKGYPAGLIRLEGGLTVNSLRKRSDILVFNSSGDKILLVECKAPHIRISEATFTQASQYNTVHMVKTLVVTNGLTHYACSIDFSENRFTFLNDIPEYAALR